MIDERMEEQCALHVLGALNQAEAREFQQKLHADPELQKYVARLNLATGALAGAVPLVEPPPQLRAKILAQTEPKQKTLSFSSPERKSWLAAWLPWAVAAGLAGVCLLLNVQVVQLRKTVSAQAEQVTTLTQLAQTLESTTNSLQQTLLAMQETNRLANLKIAMLNSMLADAPKTVAVSLWDESKQEGVFVAQNLKSPGVGKDYQLWVMDNGTTPVDAGIFHVNAEGGGRMEFKTKLPIRVAGRFALTEEVKGGVPAPTIKNMVLASN